MGRLSKRAPLRELDPRCVPDATGMLADGTHKRRSATRLRANAPTICPHALRSARATWAGAPSVQDMSRQLEHMSLGGDAFSVFEDPAGVIAQPHHAVQTRAMTAEHDHDDKENTIPT